MSMALQVFTDVMALIWQHPFISCLALLLFTPPFFPILKFFSPLLISTALFMLALFTLGPHTTTESQQGEENWEFRRAADVKVWEDKSVGGAPKRNRKVDGNWKAWVSSVQESTSSWIESKLKNEDWKGSSLNDDNVSILQEASWAQRAPSTSGVSIEEEVLPTEESRVPAALAPSALFKVDSTLKHRFEVIKLDEDAPGLAAVVEAPQTLKLASSVHHEPLGALQIPKKAVVEAPQTLKLASSVHHEPLGALQIPKKAAAMATVESPSTDLDESSDFERSRRLLSAAVRRNSMNASSGLSMVSESDADTPAAVVALSKSGKLKQIETLGELIEHSEKSRGHDLAVLKATTAEEVDAVKGKLEGFTHSSGEVKPDNASSANPKAEIVKKDAGISSPLFKAVKKSSAFSDDDSSGEEELSDSDSDSEFEIFPPVDPKKMKLHPPVKLDIQQLEKKLGTSLSQRTPLKGEPQ